MAISLCLAVGTLLDFASDSRGSPSAYLDEGTPKERASAESLEVLSDGVGVQRGGAGLGAADDLLLLDVLMPADTAPMVAMIGTSYYAAKKYTVGAEIRAGVSVTAIQADWVRLDVEGEAKVLRKVPQTQNAPETLSVDPKVRTVLTSQRRAPGELGQAIQFAEVRTGETLTALRVSPSSSFGAFRKLGLLPGDLLVEVDGKGVDELRSGERVLESISALRSATLTIMRNGMVHVVVVDVSAL